MIIKKFTAKTEEEAFSQAKAELGEGVSIIHSRNVKPKGLFSFLRRMQVEITVAMEEEMDRGESVARETIAKVDQLRQKEEKESAPEPAESTRLSETHVEEKLDNIQSLLEQKLSRQTAENKEKKEEEKKEEAKEEKTEGKKELEDFCRILYNTLTENEVSEKNANELVDDIGQNFAEGAQVEHVLSHIYQKIVLKFGKTEPISPAEKGVKIIFFVGPTGVGKTTTLAKIASKFRLSDNRKVALFTTDTYRISATDQLKTYAGILGAPFHVIYSPEELKENYANYKDFDYILVDTAGHSHNNEEQKQEMATFLNALGDEAPTEYYLVLSATTKYKDLLAIADAYKQLCPYRLIFTKLDETKECGNLLNLRLHTGASMSYVTNGQNVPEDIEIFDPQTMARMLLTEQE